MVKSDSPIRKWRMARQVTQAELCRAIGCKQANLSQIESGRNRPSFELAQRIVAHTGLALEDVMGGKK